MPAEKKKRSPSRGRTARADAESASLAGIEASLQQVSTQLQLLCDRLAGGRDLESTSVEAESAARRPGGASAGTNRRRGPRSVFCRFSWFQLDEIDLVKHTFHCKGYFEATWHDPSLREDTGELKRSQDVDWTHMFVPQILFANKAGELTHDFEKFVVNAKATEQFGGKAMASYQTVFHGDFSTSYALQKFPYDEQTFDIIVGTGHTVDECVLKKNPHISSAAPGIGEFSLNDSWALRLMDGVDGMRILPNIKGVMGDRSRCATSVRAQRKPQFYEMNVLLMNFIIMMMCFTTFAVPLNDIADRLAIAMTTMLTSVAFKTYVADQLPDISYLTFLDKYLFLGIVILVVIVVETLLMNAMEFLNDEQKQKLDQQLGGGLMVLFLGGNLVAFKHRLNRCCVCGQGENRGRGKEKSL